MISQKLFLTFGLLFAALTTPAFADECSREFHDQDPYVRLSLKDKHVTEIAQKTFKAESPVVSNDGTEITWVGNRIARFIPAYELYSRPISEEFVEPSRIHRRLFEQLNIFVKGAYNPDGSLLVAESRYRLGAITRSTLSLVRNGEWDTVGYHFVIASYRNGQRLWQLDGKDFGLPGSVALQHPRISPDSKWLTFYIQHNNQHQGVYLYNFETKKTVYLGNQADKHPTWSADGTRIFFHQEQAAADGAPELSQIGYYRLNLSDVEMKSVERVILATDRDLMLDGGYVYEKHPAYHTGLNLVFFHAQSKADGKKFIGVRSLDHPEHPPIRLKLEYQGQKIKSAKHPSVSMQDESPLYFAGKLDGDKDPRIFQLSFKALKKVREEFR